MEVKKCSKCKMIRDILMFNKNEAYKGGYTNHCKVCLRQYNRQKWSERCKDADRDSLETLRLYNVSVEDYTEMFELLTRLGYKNPLSINTDFCLKYNLEPGGTNENSKSKTYKKSLEQIIK
jgi:hypothetical protein